MNYAPEGRVTCQPSHPLDLPLRVWATFTFLMQPFVSYKCTWRWSYASKGVVSIGLTECDADMLMSSRVLAATRSIDNCSAVLSTTQISMNCTTTSANVTDFRPISELPSSYEPSTAFCKNQFRSWASTPLEHWGGRKSSAEDSRIEAP